MAPTAGFRTGLLAACVGVCAAQAAAESPITPPPPGTPRVVLSADKPTFFLGENVLIHYCLENTSAGPFQISEGSDYQFASRHQRFKITMIDERGTPVADPDPAGSNMGGIGMTPTIAAHGHWCESLQLLRYARPALPGSYTIREVHVLAP